MGCPWPEAPPIQSTPSRESCPPDTRKVWGQPGARGRSWVDPGSTRGRSGGRSGVDIGSVQGRCGVSLRSIWGSSGLDPRSFRARADPESFCGRSEVDPGSFWGRCRSGAKLRARCGVDLGSAWGIIWGRSGVDLGLIWGQSGVDLGSICDGLGLHSAGPAPLVVRPPPCVGAAPTDAAPRGRQEHRHPARRGGGSRARLADRRLGVEKLSRLGMCGGGGGAGQAHGTSSAQHPVDAMSC